MLTRGPDLAKHNNGGTETIAERNSGVIETTVDYTTSKAQADRPQSKLRALLE
jgi:hypothetical protein